MSFNFSPLYQLRFQAAGSATAAAPLPRFAQTFMSRRALLPSRRRTPQLSSRARRTARLKKATKTTSRTLQSPNDLKYPMLGHVHHTLQN
jgi:hypothetical protein